MRRGLYVKDKGKGKMRNDRNKTTWQNEEKQGVRLKPQSRNKCTDHAQANRCMK
jgi:hypothetical protein